MSRESGLIALPDNLQCHTYGYLPPLDLWTLSFVCKSINRLLFNNKPVSSSNNGDTSYVNAERDAFWKEKFARYFPMNSIAYSDWKNAFFTVYFDVVSQSSLEKNKKELLRIFAVIKENDLELLKKLKADVVVDALLNLDIKDGFSSSLNSHIVNRSTQATKDYLYILFRDYFYTEGGTLNVRKKDLHERTIFHWMFLLSQSIDVLKEFISRYGYPKDDENYTGRTPLMIAASFGLISVMRYLLDNGADVNFYPKNGYTALVCAALNDQYEAAKLLLESGADCNYACVISTENYSSVIENGDTAIMVAMAKKSSAVVQLLRRFGAKQDIVNANGNTLLHKAVSARFYSEVSNIIALGVSVNCQNYRGVTPLMIAVTKNHVEMVSLLIQLGADVLIPFSTSTSGSYTFKNASPEESVTFYSGETALHFAMKLRLLKITLMMIKMIKFSFEKADIGLFRGFISLNLFEQAGLVLEKHPEYLDQTDKSDHSELMNAVKRNDLIKVKWLLSRGAKMLLGTDNSYWCNTNLNPIYYVLFHANLDFLIYFFQYSKKLSPKELRAHYPRRYFLRNDITYPHICRLLFYIGELSKFEENNLERFSVFGDRDSVRSDLQDAVAIKDILMRKLNPVKIEIFNRYMNTLAEGELRDLYLELYPDVNNFFQK